MLVDTPANEAPQATTPTPEPAPATTPEILPDRPAPAAREDTPKEAAEQASTPEAQDAPKAEAPDVLDLLKGMSPQQRAEKLRGLDFEELFQASDWLKGKVGAAKQKATREQEAYEAELIAKGKAARDAELEAERVARLVDEDDLAGLGEVKRQEVLAQRAEREKAQAEAKDTERIVGARTEATVQTANAIGGAVWDAIQGDLDEDGKKALTKDWGSTPEGMSAFVLAAVKALSENALKAALPKLVEEGVAAKLAELNGKRLASEPTPDTRGAPPAAGDTDAEFIRKYANNESNDHARYRRLMAGF